MPIGTVVVAIGGRGGEGGSTNRQEGGRGQGEAPTPFCFLSLRSPGGHRQQQHDTHATTHAGLSHGHDTGSRVLVAGGVRCCFF
jgi:hypothetical protein